MTDATPRYSASFYGTAILTEFITDLDGNMIRQLEGDIEILTGTEALGMPLRTTGGANYGVRVAGRTQAYVVPGCKVYTVVAHDRSLPPRPGVRTVVP